MKKTNILIVADSRIAGEAIGQKLIGPGYEVSVADISGLKALAGSEKEAFDIALVDMDLGDGITGIDTAAELRRRHRIPVICLAATAGGEEVERVRKADPFGCLVHPLDESELRFAVEIALLRYRTEQRLRESAQLLETTLGCIGDGVLATGMRGNLQFINPVAERITGWTAADAVWRPVKDIFRIIDEQTRQSVDHPVDKVLSTRRPVGLASHILLLSRDGREIPIKGNAAPIVLKNGEAIGVVMVFQDATRDREVAQALRKSEFTLKRAQQAGRIGSWWYDPTVQMLTATREMALLLGLAQAPGAFPYEKLFEVVHGDDRALLDSAVTRAVDDGIGFDLDIRIVHPGAETRFIHTIGEPVKNKHGEVTELVGTVQDITARIKAEADLKQSEEKHRIIFQSASDAIFLIDVETTALLDANETAERLYGYSHDELMHMTALDLSAEPEQTRAALQKDLKSVVPIRYHRKKDGTVFPVEVTANYLTLDGRRVNVSAVRDISHRIEMEEEKNKLEAQLNQARKMESVGTLAGGIAHDFNNILSAVIGYTELSMEVVEKGSRLEDNLREILTAGQRAKDLVTQILTFARRTEGEKKPVQVGLMAKEVLKLIRSSIPTSIEIQQDIRSRALVMADPGQIHQIFMNLCTNAAQAMEMGEGVLRVRMSDVTLEKKIVKGSVAIKPGCYIRITVADTGPGIPGAQINSIFEPYFSTKVIGEGTGLGLAVVHGAVKGIDGEIFVESEPGRGAVFTVYLPVTRFRNDRLLSAEEKLPGGEERILFVDDEAPIAKMGGQILQRLGYYVTTRTSSVEALELFRANPESFDLVISDMTMPNLTGDKLAAEIMNIRPGLPVIICTGYSKKISEKSAAKIGIKALAYKPIVKAELARTIRRVLDGRESKREN